MPALTIDQFRDTRAPCADLSKTADDDCRPPAPGYLYLNGRLTIEQTHYRNQDESRACFHVELFGDDFAGTLEDCEAELHAAALDNGIFE